MRYPKFVLLGVAAMAVLCWQAPAGAVALFSIDIERTSADPAAQTFSGNGSIGFDSPTDSIADIDFFALEIETIGGTSGDLGLIVPRQFVFGLADILSVEDLAEGPTLSGLILLGSKASEDGEVVLGEGTRLDFTAGSASGFCFDAVGGAHCVFGGGSSTAIEALLNSAVVPLPPALPLLLVALGGLALAARPGAARQIAAG